MDKICKRLWELLPEATAKCPNFDAAIVYLTGVLDGLAARNAEEGNHG